MPVPMGSCRSPLTPMPMPSRSKCDTTGPTCWPTPARTATTANPRWRSYFRSTLAHNTIEVGGQDQSTSGGPFLWTRHARSRLIELETDADGEVTALVR